MSEIECRLQEDPEYNNSYVMKSLRKRGIKIEPPSIDLLANGMNLTYTPSTSTEDMSLESSQGSSSDYIFTQYGRRSSSLADELYYIDQKEFNMELTSRLKESVEDLESQAQNYNEEREVNENEIAKRLIQRQNIYATSNIETNVEMLDYLQLPIGVNDYETLESHELFPALRDEFLKDVHELKRLAKYFVQDQYDHQIDIFYENVRITDETFKEDFFILYKETRFHIRCLLTNLQRYQDDESSDIILKDYIALALHECLVGIDLLPSGCLRTLQAHFY